MNTIHFTSRLPRTMLVALLCALSTLVQSIALPIHAASHVAQQQAAGVTAACEHGSPTHGDHSDTVPAADDCAACHLLSQTADGQSLTPGGLVNLHQIQIWLRGPRPRALPTRLALNEASPRAPPAVI